MGFEDMLMFPSCVLSFPIVHTLYSCTCLRSAPYLLYGGYRRVIPVPYIEDDLSRHVDCWTSLDRLCWNGDCMASRLSHV